MSIRLEDVSATAPGQPRVLLARVNCTLRDGGITLLVGAAGAGKSTLLGLLAGLHAPASGRIVQNRGDEAGQAERTLSPRDLRSLTTLAFQSPEEQLFASTVGHELAYTLRPFRMRPEERRERSDAALAHAGISRAWFDRSPLLQSTGQRRRIALACAFAPPTPWLLLDEPTAGLDPAARSRFVQQLTAWRDGGGGSVVIATHDLSTLLPAATRVVILALGRMTADLDASDLMADPTPLEEARVGLPPESAARRLLAAAGVPLPGPDSPGLWADAICAHVGAGRCPPRAEGHRAAARRQPAPPRPSAASDADGDASAADPQATADAVAGEPSVTAPSLRTAVQGLDVRAKWLVYILLTAGVLMQHTWPGALAGALLSLGLLLYAKPPWSALWRTARAYLPFILVAALFAGAQFGPGPDSRLPVHFALAHALVTLRQLSVILIALVWGRALTIAATAGELRRGLSETAATLPFGRRAGAIFAFGAGLVLRMTAQTLVQWRRFSRIVRTRAKSSVKEGKIAVRDVPALVIPLILAMLQYAEDLTVALEARGYHTVGTHPVARRKARPLQRSDMVAVCVGAACCALLAWIAAQP